MEFMDSAGRYSFYGLCAFVLLAVLAHLFGPGRFNYPVMLGIVFGSAIGHGIAAQAGLSGVWGATVVVAFVVVGLYAFKALQARRPIRVDG